MIVNLRGCYRSVSMNTGSRGESKWLEKTIERECIRFDLKQHFHSDRGTPPNPHQGPSSRRKEGCRAYAELTYVLCMSVCKLAKHDLIKS